MATSTVAPPAPAAAPAAAPSTPAPVSTPAAPAATETPSSQPQATPASPPTTGGGEGGRPDYLDRKPGESDVEFLQRVHEAKLKERGEQQPTETKPATQPEAQPAVEQKTEEVKPAEPGKEETKPADEDALLTPELIEQSESPVLTPQQFSDLLKNNLALKDALDKDPKARGEMFKALRIAAESAPFVDMFADVDSAKFARDEAAVMTSMRDTFLSQAPENVDTTRGFLSTLAQMCVLVDDNGQPLRDEQGQIRYDPSFETFLSNTFDIQADHLRKQAESAQDQDLLKALDVIRERTRGPLPASDQELPEHLKAEKARLEAQRKELDQARQAEQTRVRERFDTAVAEGTDTHFTKRFSEIEKHYDLAPFAKEWLQEKLVDAIYDKLKSNPNYIAARNDLRRMPMTEDSKQRLMKLANKHIDRVFWDAAKPLLKQANAQLKNAQAQRDAKQASQENASKSEPRSGGTIASPAPAKSTAEELTEIRQQLGKDADTREVLAEFTKRQFARRGIRTA